LHLPVVQLGAHSLMAKKWLLRPYLCNALRHIVSALPRDSAERKFVYR
jgi:hypothetical protein